MYLWFSLEFIIFTANDQFMEKTLIVAFDYSKESDSATDFAIQTAKAIGARIVMFHLHNSAMDMINSRVATFSVADALENFKMQAQSHVLKLQEKYDYPLELEWTTGNFHDELKKVIEKYETRAVVMGMPEKSLEQELLGNTTTSAIHKLRVPVLAVPRSTKYTGVKQILFACDVEKGVEEQVLQRVREVAMSYGAQVTVFYVQKKVKDLEAASTDSPILKILEDGLEGVSYTYKNVSSNAVIQAIHEEVKNIQADLLIMVPQKQGFWASMVHRSKTRQMASHSEVPLFTIPL